MGIKISALPPIVTPALSDIFPVVQSGVTYKETFTQLSSLFANAPVNTNITSMTGLTGIIQAPTFINDINGNPVVGFGSAASAVNYTQLLNSATGNHVELDALGTDSDIGINIRAKGLGPILLISSALTTPIAITNGTGAQHSTNFAFANTAFSRTITFPDNDGTVPFTGTLVSGNLIMASNAYSITDSGLVATAQSSVASVSLTSSQFTNMYTTPILLVPAPGANNLIVVDKMEVIMTFVSAAYDNGGIVGAQYDSTAHLAGVLATNTEQAADFFAGASTVFVFNGVSGNTVGALPFTTTVNKGVYISNQTAVWITGDSTFVVKVYYRIVATV
jgi:hypothetical protein